MEAPSLLVNLYSCLSKLSHAPTTEDYINTRHQTLQRSIQRMELQQSTILLDVANLVTRALSEKMRM